jgi:fluoride ion exporter CrcB/FEX
VSSPTTLSSRQLLIAVGSVAVGGAVGTLLRDGATSWHLVTPTNNWVTHVPWALLVINGLGVFIVTRLLAVSMRGRDVNDPLRLLVVTGFFGGLTSYSGIFVALHAIWQLSVAGAISTAVFALFSGVLCAGLGLMKWDAK